MYKNSRGSKLHITYLPLKGSSILNTCDVTVSLLFKKTCVTPENRLFFCFFFNSSHFWVAAHPGIVSLWHHKLGPWTIVFFTTSSDFNSLNHGGYMFPKHLGHPVSIRQKKFDRTGKFTFQTKVVILRSRHVSVRLSYLVSSNC